MSEKMPEAWGVLLRLEDGALQWSDGKGKARARDEATGWNNNDAHEVSRVVGAEAHRLVPAEQLDEAISQRDAAEAELRDLREERTRAIGALSAELAALRNETRGDYDRAMGTGQ